MKLSVINVGQGNFNVVSFDGFNVVYDLGAPINSSKHDDHRIINEQESFFREKFILIISHWDVDHYKLIFELKGLGYLANMLTFICPEVRPNLTSKRAYALIQKYNRIQIKEVPNLVSSYKKRGFCRYEKFTDINLLDFIRPSKYPLLTIMRTSSLLSASLKVYHSVKRADRNRNSLIVTIKINQKNLIILTGDSFYKDINEFVIKEDIQRVENVLFLVPHHGGGGGNFDLSHLVVGGEKMAFISTGKNSYGHPLQYNIDKLEVDFGRGNLYVTSNILGTLSKVNALYTIDDLNNKYSIKLI